MNSTYPIVRTDGGTTFWKANTDCPECGSTAYTDNDSLWCGSCDWGREVRY